MAEVGSPQIGPFILQFRKQQAMTLDTLAKLSGVSRSMLSQIERGQTNPTLATVWALANALKVELSELIGARPSEPQPLIEVASAAFTPEIRTDDATCTLRILSPADRAGSLEWYDIRVEPGGALVSSAHTHGTREHLTIIEGMLSITIGNEQASVPTGATARYAADVPHEIRNPSSTTARALLMVVFG